MGILDKSQSMCGMTHTEFIEQQKGTILEPYAKKMWNAMAWVQFNDSQAKEVMEYRDMVIESLGCLLEMLNITLRFDRWNLKAINWDRLGDEYHRVICKSFTDIIVQSFQEWQDLLIEHDDPHKYDQNITFIDNYLKVLPEPDSIAIDEQTEVITRDSLRASIKTVNSLIKTLKGLSGKDLRVGRLIEEFYLKGGIPQNNKFYSEIYNVLDKFGIIPPETKEAHKKSGFPYVRANYIKSFVNRIKKKK